jgi:hypothetical protein
MPYQDIDFIENIRRRNLQAQLGYDTPTISPYPIPQYQPVIPPANQAPVPQNQSQMQPVAPIQAPQQGSQPQIQPQQAIQARPAADDLQNYLKTEPQLADNHPGKLRNIFASVLGAIAGAGQGPKVGMAVHGAVQNAPFQKKVNIFQQGLKQRQAAAGLESDKIKQGEEAEKSRATVSHLISQGKAEEERAAAEKARRVEEETKTSAGPKTFEDTLQLEAGKHPPKTRNLDGPWEVPMADGSKALAMLDREDGNFYHQGTNDIIDRKSIKGVPIKKEPSEGTSAFARLYATKEKELGRPLTSDEITKVIKDTSPSNSPVMVSFRESQIAENKSRTEESENRLNELSDENVNMYYNSMKKDPFVVFNIKNQQLANKVLQKWTKDGYDIPQPLTSQEKDRLDAANISQGHSAYLLKMVDDPDVQKNIGTILGKVGELEQWTGGNIRGLPDSVQEKGQEIRNRFVQLMLQEAKTAVGGRPSYQITNLIKKVSARPGEAISLIKGALKGVSGSAQIIRNEIYGAKAGGYHPDNSKAGKIATEEDSTIPSGTELVRNPKTGKLEVKK